MHQPDFANLPHDPSDPNPWAAIFLDKSLPLSDEVKSAWLRDTSSPSRQYLMPVVRPLGRVLVILIQLLKFVLPKNLSSSTILHRFLSWGLKTWVRPEANWLILRHFHLGSQILDFIAENTVGVDVESEPLRPRDLDDLKDHVFVKHDMNLFNFVIEFNRQLREQGLDICGQTPLDFSCMTEVDLDLSSMPNRWSNFIDISSAIELFTPVYQLFLTDSDFWRATNSLQLDETLGIYAAKLLQDPQVLAMVNNKHPLVPMSTLRAGYRLLLHGLATETLHATLLREKIHRRSSP